MGNMTLPRGLSDLQVTQKSSGGDLLMRLGRHVAAGQSDRIGGLFYRTLMILAADLKGSSSAVFGTLNRALFHVDNRSRHNGSKPIDAVYSKLMIVTGNVGLMTNVLTFNHKDNLFAEVFSVITDPFQRPNNP